VTTPWISYDAFPHIINLVLSHADWDVLLAVRMTCRSLRTQADAYLAHHLALTAKLKYTPNKKGCPIETAIVTLREPRPPYRVLPGFPPREVPVVRECFVWAEAFPIWLPVSILETYGDGVPPGHSDAGQDIRLLLLRDWSPGTRASSFFKADCVVGYRPFKGVVISSFSASTVVLYLEWPDSSHIKFKWGAIPGPATRDIIYVFPPGPADPNIAVENVERLHNAVGCALDRPYPPQITIVGLDTITSTVPAASHETSTTLGETLQIQLSHHLDAWVGRLGKPDTSRLRFIRRDELRDLDLHPLALETEPMPDAVWFTRRNLAVTEEGRYAMEAPVGQVTRIWSTFPRIRTVNDFANALNNAGSAK
jgi:hypothetical protein